MALCVLASLDRFLAVALARGAFRLELASQILLALDRRRGAALHLLLLAVPVGPLILDQLAEPLLQVNPLAPLAIGLLAGLAEQVEGLGLQLGVHTALWNADLGAVVRNAQAAEVSCRPV